MRISFIIMLFLFSFLACFDAACANRGLSKVKSWVVFYEGEFPQGIPYFDLYILDSSNHPDVIPLKQEGKKVVGYVSFGEVAKHNDYFKAIENQKLLVDQNENWPDSYRVNIKEKAWHNFLIDIVIPKILAQGFEGVFIDTIDTADYLENVKKIPGSLDGAKKLIESVRKHFPKMIIILNNGLSLIEGVGKDIDALLVEDVYTLYDFKKKKYQLTTEEWTKERLVPIKRFQEKFKRPVLTLDYLDKNDKKGIKKIVIEAKKDNLLPYISDIHLKTIFFHP